MWKTKSHTPKYKNKWIEVWEDGVQFSKGHSGIYGFMKHGNVVHAVVVNKDNKIILFRQYRYPVKKYVWSIPGGEISKDENMEQAIRREVKEEIGVNCTTLEQLGDNWEFVSAIDTGSYSLFLARTCDKPQVGGDVDESIKDVKEFTFQEALVMIDKGEITETYVANAIQFAARRLGY